VTRVLVISSEAVGERMAGPAIRALELARALASRCEVTLAAPPGSAVDDAPFELLPAGLADFDALVGAVARHDVVVAQRLPAQLLRHVRRLPVRYVADLYNPLMMEVLEAVGESGAPRRDGTVRRAALSVLAQCAAADYIVCASEKQRDLWLGGMGVAGLIDADSYGYDPTYRSFIDVVPFGVPERPPRSAGPVLKGVWPGIGPEDRVLLWGGGVWRWLDALTPIRAVERLAGEGLPVHLFFLGVDRPSVEPASVPSSAAEAIAYAHERGLEGRCVHFKPGWTPYAERAAYLLDSDLGVSAHRDHLEARFSFRTRVLDYLWAGLPVVTSAGDAIGDLVEREALGVAVAPGDDAGFAAACAELLDPGRREEAAGRARALAPSLRWSEAIRPLLDYCVAFRERPVPRRDPAVLALATFGQYPALAAHLRETRGAAEVARRVGRYLARSVRHRGSTPGTPGHGAP
jgi:glycosyltransferase involved in cell wall biosynthesis